ncbi:DUF488 domain-containing protein [Mycolicibacterium monacense]|uniref:DUF488 domain-containing protein n=4 Tax=Mycobacteriaceae TaxID=1762 RepID=A0AAD1ISB4_MYCMB|nr:DUF488 domain-containing protein [Mycolicibacterium monacense]ORB15453.1 hypothetical protein BST34_21490 [Mycolicibacterium monacense DSM 44395]QHP87978.1 DUF488 domain-containing protein [Mycolicibacterium monacense DSM 44395]BBZ58817.1 hypothetical protein MMON_01180 [Mycolicibacterium monacense]
MLLTAGHGRLSGAELTDLLRGAGVTSLIDIRRFPGSRTNPDMSRDAMASWLPAAGIGYRWEARLGGRRRLTADEPRDDPWWQVEQFAAYAAHTRTAEFDAALTEVLDESGCRTVLVMCSESVWWRCHRRLVADVAVLRFSAAVSHLMHDGRLTPHPVAAGARLRDDGFVVWDGAVQDG